MQNFHVYEHLGCKVWQHNSAPVWVREYTGQDIYTPTRYGAYKSTERVPEGRKPWTVNSVRVAPISTNLQATLNAAIEAAEEFEV
jgi:hypothetical protein